MAKIDLSDVASGYNRQRINQNFQDIESELNNKVLYRNNPAGEPNQMENDIDMNSNDIINANLIQTDNLTLQGQEVIPSDLALNPAAINVTYDNTASGLAAFSWRRCC